MKESLLLRNPYIACFLGDRDLTRLAVDSRVYRRVRAGIPKVRTVCVLCVVLFCSARCEERPHDVQDGAIR